MSTSTARASWLQAYLEYLWSKEGQENAAQNYIRPHDVDIMKKYAAQFPAIKTFTVADTFGGWDKATAGLHFKDGGTLLPDLPQSSRCGARRVSPTCIMQRAPGLFREARSSFWRCNLQI